MGVGWDGPFRSISIHFQLGSDCHRLPCTFCFCQGFQVQLRRGGHQWDYGARFFGLEKWGCKCVHCTFGISCCLVFLGAPDPGNCSRLFRWRIQLRIVLLDITIIAGVCSQLSSTQSSPKVLQKGLDRPSALGVIILYHPPLACLKRMGGLEPLRN